MSQETDQIEQYTPRDASIRQMCISGAIYLEQHGVDESRHQAELIIMHLLGIERQQLVLMWAEPFPESLLTPWRAWLIRKAQGEPIQYMIGEAWFYSRAFKVTPDVLIPRPETELLVEAVLKAADTLWPPTHAAAPTVLDVGTGSGAIAVTLQAERPQWRVIASDLSPDAINIARTNAGVYGLDAQIAWVQGDLLQPFVMDGNEALIHQGMQVDILVSNPPYIPEGDMAELQPEVRDYEPRLALVGGVDGLNPYRAMLRMLQTLKSPPRIVAFELGIHQPAIVAELMKEIGLWDDISIVTDYGGIDRHIIAIKK